MSATANNEPLTVDGVRPCREESSSSVSHSQTSDDTPLPIVVVGNGPVGMRAVTELFARNRKQPVVVYGQEAQQPYDRIKLSSWLAGDVDWNGFVKPYRRPFGASLVECYGARVVAIDADEHIVSDSQGESIRYSKLILATGSRAFVPDIPGIRNEGVFTLRDLADALKLMARRASSHHTVVIGGGLLGLETARGLKPMNTRVTIVEHSDRLMANQLDERAGALLRENVESLGFEVVVGDGIKEVQGRSRVNGVALHSGRLISCDTVIVAAGIRPRIELARQAGLAWGRGIKVDDRMQTSNPDIYAIGECAEHRDQVYGLVAPGYEQAAVAASDIASQDSRYKGSIVASRLKVVETSVFSIGPVGHTAHPLAGRSLVYEDKRSGTYRKLLIDRHRLIGAIGLGDWPQSLRTQVSVNQRHFIYPWQRLRFRLTGDLWANDSGNDVVSWPEPAIVCQCTGVSRGRIGEVIAQGANSVPAVGQACAAGTVCGSCKPLLSSLLGLSEEKYRIIGRPWLVTLMTLSLLFCATILLLPAVPYASSVQSLEFMGRSLSWHWDTLWRSTLLKQITGFTVLGLIVLASMLSLRKRVTRLESAGTFDYWRIAHVALSAFALLSLLAHTGFRMGHGLNFYLMSLFLGLCVLGVATTLALTISGWLPARQASTIRQHSQRWHIYLAWPIPVLLGWHILKGYWY